MKKFYCLVIAVLFVFCSHKQKNSMITGNINYEGNAPTDSVYIGLYPLGAERYLGGYEQLQTTMAADFSMQVDPGLYTLVLYSYEYEKFRQNLFIPDKETTIHLDIFLPRLGVPDSIGSVDFHGGTSPNTMNWRENRPMEKRGNIWVLSDPSIIDKGEKYQIWVNGQVMWDLREKDYTVIHGWTTINNLYSGGEIIFDPSLYARPKKEPTVKITGVKKEYDLAGLAAELNTLRNNARKVYPQLAKLEEDKRDSIYLELCNEYDALAQKHPQFSQPIIEAKISSLSNLHPQFVKLRKLWSEARGDTAKIYAYYQTNALEGFVSDMKTMLDQLDPNSYLLKGWFADDFLFLDDVVQRSPAIKKQLHINDNHFSDYLLSFANNAKSDQCAANIYYIIGSSFVRSQDQEKQLKGEKVLEQLVENYPQNRNVQAGYVDLVLQSIKVTAGSEAPNFNVKTLAGDSLRLSDLRGKFVFLDFWGSWCGPCRGETPYLKKLDQAFPKEKFQLIGLANDDLSSLSKYIQDEQILYPNVLASQDLLKEYGISAYPTTFLINPDGKIAAKNLRGEKLVELVKNKMREYNAQ
jgi:thiol-disulfide isomerase/thioredoxin